MSPFALRRTLLSLLAITALLWSVFTVQTALDDVRGSTRLRQMPYLPNKHLLRSLSVDFDLLTADFLWIEATDIALPSERDPSKIDSEAWFYVLDTITEMDPYFKVVYRYGGSYLPRYGNNLERGNQLLQKALRWLPEEWEFAAILSFNAAHLSHPPDQEAAIRYMEQAAQSPSAPQYVREMSAMMHTQAGNRTTSMRMLLLLFDGADSGTLRQAYLKETVVLAGEIFDQAAKSPGPRAAELAADLDALLGEFLQAARDVGDAARRQVTENILRELDRRLGAQELPEPRFAELLRRRAKELNELPGG
ncbi:MAG: hypothetical protein HYZ53_00945 [Planctomycetes bacterium]|nr:hypothetical protein [Planctomycetota bacterium]